MERLSIAQEEKLKVNPESYNFPNKSTGLLLYALVLLFTTFTSVQVFGVRTFSSMTVSSQSATVSYGSSNNVSVTYTVTWNATGSGNPNPLTSGTFSITGLPSGVSGSFSPTTVSATSSNNSPTTTLTLTITTSTIAAGSYTFTVSDGSGHTRTGSLVISKASLTIDANDAIKTYGSAISGGSGSTAFTTTGLQNNETVGSVTITYGTGSLATAAAGTYTGAVTPSSATGGTFSAANYNLTYTNGNIIVNPAVLTISGISASSKTYDGLTSTAVTGTATYVGLKNGQTFSVTGTPAANFASSSAGTGKTVSVTGYNAPSANYTVTQPSLTANITARALTITASSLNKTYGLVLTSGAGSVDFSASGLQNGETIGSVYITYGTGSAASATVGTYNSQVVASLPTGGTFSASNYSISYLPGNITVVAKSLTITANNISKCFGTTLTFSGTEFATTQMSNSDAVTSVTLSSPGTSGGAAAGTYAISISSAVGTGLSNYTISYVPGTLTINSIPVITGTITGTICGSGTVTLGATSSVGTINWFAAESGGTVLESGNSFTTPVITTTTTYYVEGSNGGCLTSPRTAVVATVNRSGYWTGAVSTDWNNINNWECSELPGSTTDVLISNGKSRYPVLTSGAAGTVKNLTIESAASLTVSGNTLKIAGTISTNATGSFTATSGTVELNGSAAQTIPANTFTGNTIMDLSINNASGVTLGGTLSISGIVWPVSGAFNSGGFLTLLSTASQTALVSGSGSGSISGNINVQRYLSNAYGYKYLSSPVGNATVAQLSGYLSSTATIPKIYRYDENNTNAGAAISGWVNYTTSSNPLNVMEGYAVNLGSSASPALVTISGTANSGSVSNTLYNHNALYTQGFNLVGNPYPSPIDWNAVSGWTRTNIDGAIYFFSANGDEYSGTYSSYTNGIAGADGDNIIPAMQGFFVHVSSGNSSGTLGMNNSVRINKMNPTFKSAEVGNRKILRFSASFDENASIPDPFVLYFDESSTMKFDPETDALKLMNTNQSVPNVYAITPDVRQLSISGIPIPSDSLTKIPLGIKILKNGWVNFSARDIEQLPASLYLYLYDSENKSYTDLKTSPKYRFYLKSGQYDQRFDLVMSKSDLTVSAPLKEKPFKVTRNGSTYQANILPGSIESGVLYVRNMAGQTIQQINIDRQQTIEICQGVQSGVYIVTIVSGDRIFSEKTLIRKE